MQAITTRYLGPTATRGSRIKALTTSGISVTVPYDHALNSDQNHMQACKALMVQIGWTGEMVSGGAPDQTGYVFCFVNSALRVSA